ncbi:Por secretion system C-terminal sorting domain-containing protein [Chitinophaga sp. YR627]|uniref:FG-GAP-like repeat-containing protein n=1 Tax=Chitinophaga sp. YR627 TaxID=1881041 RepID=UPI0008E734E7|nr:FG-GAP-like repeat-containing protein [Chitinophaga sp. YR627]SFM90954.1 Por secretion system C-terminal sorting domain-containing protein [Chitinophaga sp. YR627]
MKRIYLLGSMLLAVCSVHANTDPVIEKGTLNQIEAQLARSEYFIQWQSNAGIYQSNNRKNSLLATYTAQEMRITPRNTPQQWSFGLSVKGVSADGRPLYQPAAQTSVKLNDGTVQFNHDNHYTVEYVNNDEGIRQNFIIQQPAVPAQTLSVQLQASEGWKTVKRNETSLTFTNKQQVLSYNDLKVWDANGTILSAHFSLQDNQVQIAVDVRKAVYPITIDPIVLNGTPQNANSFLQNNIAFSLMGFAVARGGHTNNDIYDDVILAAPGYQPPNGGQGAVFVYYGTNRGINPARPTLLPNIVGEDGIVVIAGGGDLNDDGFDDVVTAAPFDSILNVGGIAVFYGSPTGVVPIAEIIPGGSNEGRFVDAIAISEDLDGDFIDDIIVGSPYASKGQANEGLVTIIPGGPWGPAYTVWTIIEGNQAAMNLGRQVKAAGDVNGDSYNDIVVTATNKVFVYYGGPSGVSTTPGSTMNVSHHPIYGALFSIAAGGDINGDGHTDIIMGKSDYLNDLSYKGAVLVFYGSTTGFDSIPAQVLGGTIDSLSYGSVVAFAGDINNDGFSDIIVGEPDGSNDLNQVDEGMAYVYYGRSNGINPVPASTIQSNQRNGILGYSVAGAGDVNGDGYSDVLIGSIAFSNGQALEGAGFVYHGGAGSAGLVATTARTTTSKTASVLTPTPSNINIFPKQVINSVSVQLKELDSQVSTEIQIMTLQGKIVQTVKAGSVANYQQSIDLSKLTPGAYLLIIRNGEKTFYEKIVKQ